MPQTVDDKALAASTGGDTKRELARKNVARVFLQEHLFDGLPEAERDWELVRRVLQCIDFTRPISFGPQPTVPPRLVALRSEMLGKGFFAEPDGTTPSQQVDREAPYMRYFAAASSAGSPRYLIPRMRKEPT